MLVNVNVGHQHPRVVAAIQAQAGLLATVSPAYANEARSEAAARLLDHAPDGFARVFFTNGGADANENAIRMARSFTGRDKVVSAYRSYHGNTGAAVVATGDWRRQRNEYSRGHVHVFGPYLYRSEFWATTEEEERDRALHHLESVIQAEGCDSIAAILLETIPGAAGVLVPPPGYLAGVRRIADRYGIVLILDEVMSGFGRAGSWFAFEVEDVRPDLIVFAKGVNSGYVPVGGVLVAAHISRFFDDEVFRGGMTSSGHPLAAASIVATIDAMEDDDIVGNAARMGAEFLGPALHALQLAYEIVGEVRGRGVFWALELVSDRQSREPLGASAMRQVEHYLLDHGLLVFTRDNRVLVAPPAIIGPDQIAQGVALLGDAFRAIEAESPPARSSRR